MRFGRTRRSSEKPYRVTNRAIEQRIARLELGQRQLLQRLEALTAGDGAPLAPRHGLYLNAKDAAAYCARSVPAFRKFAQRHGLQRFGDGTFRKERLGSDQTAAVPDAPGARPLGLSGHAATVTNTTSV